MLPAGGGGGGGGRFGGWCWGGGWVGDGWGVVKTIGGFFFPGGRARAAP